MSAWVVETLVASGLLMLGVLMLRGPVANVFGPRAAYGLWILPAARMALPPLPQSVIAPPLAALPQTIHLSATDIEAYLASPLAVSPVSDPIAWGPLLLAVWLGGAAVHFGWHLLSYRRFVARTLGGARQLPMFDREGVEVCASTRVGGPFATGIFHKTIVLPGDYRRRYTVDELRLAMAHELEHHRRCDMSVNLIALATLSLHWFNPIAHRAHRAFRVDQELACDAIVLAGASPADRHAYGSALLKSAYDRLPVAACALGAGDDLKRRLTMMAFNRPSRAQMRIGGVITAILTGGGLLLTASGGIAAETARKMEKTVTVITDGVVTRRAATPHEVAMVKKTEASARHADREARIAARIADVAPPEPPLPVEAPEPPAPPAPPSSAIDEEIDRSVAAAMRDVEIGAADAQRGAAHARQYSAIAIRVPQVRVAISCDHGPRVRSWSNGQGSDHAIHTQDCANWSGPDEAEIRRNVIDALTRARAQLSAADFEELGRASRQSALASIDKQLARLRAE